MTETTHPRYFAASNSCKGFCNYYGEIFAEPRVDRLYIIKGGPGTGKSHFMKTVARRARHYGYSVTEYACSSDPASLDGILMTRESSPAIGILDGTAPHVCEPTLPGVKEEIINLGTFWDSRLLVGQSDLIRALTAGKAAAYQRAYAYLSACGDVNRAASSLMADCIRTDRMESLADRILRHRPRGEVFTPTPALRRAVGMTGQVCLHTFEQLAAEAGGTVLITEDYYGLGFCLTRALFEQSRRACHELLVSYDPIYLDQIDGLYYPSDGLCILVGHAEPGEGTAVRTISLRRYANAEILREIRGELRHAYALRDRLTESALHELASAAACHFDLESVYSAAMDFPQKEAFTENFCKTLFSEKE